MLECGISYNCWNGRKAARKESSSTEWTEEDAGPPGNQSEDLRSGSFAGMHLRPHLRSSHTFSAGLPSSSSYGVSTELAGVLEILSLLIPFTHPAVWNEDHTSASPSALFHCKFSAELTPHLVLKPHQEEVARRMSWPQRLPAY